MKKGLILTTALAMVLGVGVAVGAHHAEARQVKATSVAQVAGSFNSWTPADMTLDGDYYVFERDFAVDDEFKVVVNGTDWVSANWNGISLITGIIDGGGDDHNFKISVAATYKIKAVSGIGSYGEKGYGVSFEKVEPPEEHTYSYRVNSGTVVEMEEGTGTEYVSVERNFDKYDSVEFLKDGVLMEVTPKDLYKLTKLYIRTPTKLGFAENYSGALYLDTSANTVWAGQFTPGYYLAGVNDNWEPKLAVPAVAHEDSFLVSNIHITANTEVKFVQAPENGAFNWKSADPAKFTKGEGVSASVISSAGLGNGNLKVEETGDYDLYYTPESQWVSIYNYVAPPADPVYTVSCRFNDPVEFVLDEEDKPAGVVHQYSAQVQYACRGGILQFFKDGVEITSGIGVGDDENNNIYGNVTDGFRLAHTVDYLHYTKLYLKTYSDGGISVWGDGYEDNVFSSYIKDGNGGTTTVYMTLDKTYEPNETYVRQYKTSAPVALKALSGTDGNTSFNLDHEGLSEDITPETVEGNNAMQAFQRTMWKVHNDCEEVIYIKERASDLELFIYVGGYEDAHVLTIGGNNVTLHKYDENQYRALGVTLSAGDVASAYTIEGVAQEFTAKVVGNNNLGTDKTIIASGTCDIYFNTTNNTLFVSGLPTGGYHLLKNDTLVEMIPAGEYEGFTQYKSEKITFHVGDEIKFVDCNGAEGVKAAQVFAISAINGAGLGSKFSYNGASEVIECIEDCTAAVYLKLKYQQDEIYFGAVAEYIEEAIAYANAFKSAMATACSAEGKKATVEAAWAAQATAFSQLSEEAQNELKLGGYSSVEEVQEFGDRYMGIKSQHLDWNLENFLEWDVPASPAFVSTGEQNSVSKNANILIIIVAAVSVISLATLIVIKKRKHN